MSEKEKKYRRVGWITSAGVQLVLLILFYFLIAWKDPFPPIPSYGIELSFGVEQTGRGQQPISTPQPVEEVQEENSEAVEKAAEESPTDEIAEEFSDPELDAVEESVAEQNSEPISNAPSPDVVEPKPEVKKEVVKEQPKKSEPEKPKVETKEVKEEKTLNPAATMPQSNDAELNNSKGEDAKEGIAGKKEGNIDGRALMGEQGASNGASLQMAGWVWDSNPEPRDQSSESGKIVYKIKIDQDGYIIGIELVSSTVSPVVERYYRQSVERLSFSKTNDYKPAPTSSGTITFIIRSK
ncbi:MAG: hypothetical protein RIC35_13490 [Marinoscillum sp.]